MSANTHKEPLTCPQMQECGEQSRDNPVRAATPSASEAGMAISADQATPLPRDIICSFDALYKAMLKASKNVMWKDSVAGYVANGLQNIVKLRNGLLSGKYSISNYIIFFVYEPKKRQIVSTRFKDRTFQKSLCSNYLYHELARHFIYDNAACLRGKGTDFAIGRLKRHLQKFYREHNKNGFISKYDIKDFFGQTQHSVASAAVEKRAKDRWVLSHIGSIIDSFNQGEDPGRGMGLGSEVTQLVQLAVMDDIDHFVKEQLHIKYYIRYNDDFILIHEDKEYLKYCQTEIEKKLAEIGLRLNNKKTQTYPVTHRICFLGFSCHLTDTGKVVIRILPENVKKERRKLKKLVGRAAQGLMARREVDDCYEGWKAHAKRGNTHKEILRMDAYYKSLWGDYYHVQVQRYRNSAPGGESTH